MEEEPVRVLLRCRPPSEFADISWDINGKQITLRSSTDTEFFGDEVYDSMHDNESLFRDNETLVDDALNGYNTGLCCYGHSGSGKTHTLFGTNEESGLVQMVMKKVLESPKELNRTYMIRLSMVEIYNEVLRDLLVDNSSKEVKIVEMNDVPRVLNLTEMKVTKLSEMEEILAGASERKKVAETKLNARSSRAHTIVMIHIDSTTNNGRTVRSSKIFIVDLAGSENSAAAGTSGQTFKEGTNINKSLFTLTRVITLLSESQKSKNRDSHLPFRDSKLTRILKPCLGGNAKTVVICCISITDVTETLATLKFAKQVKNVISCPVINEGAKGGDADDGVLAKYCEEIARLKKMLDEAKSETGEADEERKKMRQLMEQLISNDSAFRVVANPQAKIKTNRRMTWAPGAGGVDLFGSRTRNALVSPTRQIEARHPFPTIEELEDNDTFSTERRSSICRRDSEVAFKDIVDNPLFSTSRRYSGTNINDSGSDGTSERLSDVLPSHQGTINSLADDDVAKYEQKITELEDKNAVVMKELLMKNEALLETMRCMASMKEETVLLGSTVNEFRRDVDERVAEIINTTASQIVTMQGRMDVHTDSLKIRINVLAAANEELKNELRNGELGMAERERLISDAASVRTLLIESCNQVEALQSELKDVRDATQLHIMRAASAEGNVKFLEDELATRDIVVAETRAAVDQKIKEEAEEKALLARELSMLRERHDALLNENSHERIDVELNTAERERLISDAASVRTLLLESINQVDALQSELKDARDAVQFQIVRATSAEGNVKSLQVELASMRDTIVAETRAAVEQKMKEDAEEKAQLAKELFNLRERHEALLNETLKPADPSTDQLILEAKNKELEAKIFDLHQEATKASSIALLNDDLVEKVAKLQFECDAGAKKLENSKATIDIYQSRIQTQRSDLQLLDNDLAEQKNTAKRDKQEWESKQVQFEDELRNAHGQIKNLTSSLNKCMESDRKLSQDMEVIKVKKERADLDLIVIKKQLAEANERIMKIGTEASKDANERVIAIESELASERIALAEANKNIDNLTKDRRDLRMKLDKAMKMIGEAHRLEETSELAEENSQLKTRVEALAAIEESLRIERKRVAEKEAIIAKFAEEKKKGYDYVAKLEKKLLEKEKLLKATRPLQERNENSV